jgi:ligand-binding sensor protein
MELANQLQAGCRFTMYRCKNGLTDCASPIVIDGEHVANLFIGQFLLAPSNQDFFTKQAAEFAFPVDEYLRVLGEVLVVKESRLPAIMNFLTHYAQLVAGMAL